MKNCGRKMAESFRFPPPNPFREEKHDYSSVDAYQWKQMENRIRSDEEWTVNRNKLTENHRSKKEKEKKEKKNEKEKKGKFYINNPGGNL